jgi:hypothetical protein
MTLKTRTLSLKASNIFTPKKLKLSLILRKGILGLAQILPKE